MQAQHWPSWLEAGWQGVWPYAHSYLAAHPQVELVPGGQGPYALVLPLIDGDFRCTLRPGE